jgi:hypothetical protein
MQLKTLDEVCGMDESTKAEVEQSDRLVLTAIKDGVEKPLISIIPAEKKIKAFKAAAMIAGTDYDLVVRQKN